MFRSEINGWHENQEVCLTVFPPQITAGETALAQLEPADPSWHRARRGVLPWRLVCDETQLGAADSCGQTIPFSFDQPGQKHLLAMTWRGGSGHAVLARTNLLVHSQVEDEIAYIVTELDQFGARRWFKSIVERRHDDAYRDKLDLALGSYLDSQSNSVRKTAFILLLLLRDRALRKAAARFLRRDDGTIDDVMQEAKKGAWRSLKKFQIGNRFGPWIHKALLNACKDATRKTPLTPGNIDREMSSYAEAVEAIDARDAVGYLTRDLAQADADILRLWHGEDMSLIEIAHAMNIQPDRPEQTRVTTVRRRAERALRAAQSLLGDMSDTGGVA